MKEIVRRHAKKKSICRPRTSASAAVLVPGDERESVMVIHVLHMR